MVKIIDLAYYKKKLFIVKFFWHLGASPKKVQMLRESDLYLTPFTG
jgi:hypothetical protein